MQRLSKPRTQIEARAVSKLTPTDKIKGYWEFLRANDLPAWDKLTPEMRLAIIKIWAAGERHALEVATAEI